MKAAINNNIEAIMAEKVAEFGRATIGTAQVLELVKPAQYNSALLVAGKKNLSKDKKQALLLQQKRNERTKRKPQKTNG